MTLFGTGDEFRAIDMVRRGHGDVCRHPDHGGECVSQVSASRVVSVNTVRVPVRRSSPTPFTVLIVDDDLAITQTFGRILRLEGYAVRTAVSADGGLHEVEVSHPDVILLDLRMPVVDGLAFLRLLRAHQHQRDTPVAIITGDYFFDDTVSNELRELGAHVYFKPIWLDDLVQIVQGLVNVH